MKYSLCSGHVWSDPTAVTQVPWDKEEILGDTGVVIFPRQRRGNASLGAMQKKLSLLFSLNNFFFVVSILVRILVKGSALIEYIYRRFIRWIYRIRSRRLSHIRILVHPHGRRAL